VVSHYGHINFSAYALKSLGHFFITLPETTKMPKFVLSALRAKLLFAIPVKRKSSWPFALSKPVLLF